MAAKLTRLTHKIEIQLSLQAASPETFVYTLVRCENVDWIHLAQDSVQWRDLVNTVMNFRFYVKIYCTS
jgi:hypothetical protein